METITINKVNGEAIPSRDIALAISLLRNGRYTLTIKREREGTAAQNRLLWSWMNAVARETGCDPKNLYKALCVALLPRKVAVMGEMYTVPGDPKELPKEVMSQFLDAVRDYVMRTFGIKLPRPEDRVINEFMERYG